MLTNHANDLQHSAIPASSVLFTQSLVDGKIHHIKVQLPNALNEQCRPCHLVVTYEFCRRGSRNEYGVASKVGTDEMRLSGSQASR